MEQQVEAGGQAALDTQQAERRMTADEARESLARRYKIESAFVRVAQLSKILGIATPTIYSAMREGRFFLPHRMLCSMPAVRLDDLAEWYSRQERPSPKVRRQADENNPATNAQARTASEAREEIIARVLAKVKARHGGERNGSKTSRAPETKRWPR